MKGGSIVKQFKAFLADLLISISKSEKSNFNAYTKQVLVFT